MRKTVIGIIVYLSLFLHNTPIIKANQIIYSEDFSDPEGINDWTVLQNEGDNKWEVCLDTARPADWHIKDTWMGIVLDGTSCITVIAPHGLDLSEYSGYQFDLDLRMDESIDMDRNLLLLWQDKDNWYDIKLYGTGVHLEKVVDGVAQSLPNAQVTYPFQKDTTYHFTLVYTPQRQISVFINSQLVIESQDQVPFLDGYKTLGLKTALGGGRRSVAYYDNLVVRSFGLQEKTPIIDGTSLPVKLFLQDDLRWADQEYDTASEWSRHAPTIRRWGCALSSMAMILDYYGITQFPDGTILTPASLNEWLHTQPDGYIGEGLLNWLAVTRLTQQISELRGTPKLEYSYQGGNEYHTTINEVEKGQPAILAIPGHFLVATGFSHDLSDLIINDPFYEYTHFSQHHTELVSTRVFTPSYTDLSYWLIVTDQDTTLTVTNENSDQITLQEVQESLHSDDETDEQTETTQNKIYQIAKPESGTYQFQFSNTQKDFFDFSILNYDHEGKVTIHDQKKVSSNDTPTHTFAYTKEDVIEENSEKENSNLQKSMTWEIFKESIIGYLGQQLLEKFIADYLLTIIGWAEIEQRGNQLRYIQLLNRYIENSAIADLIKAQIVSDLNSL